MALGSAKKGTEANPIFFKSPADYRKWLEKNHDKASELWIGYWKKHTGKPSLTWKEMVDESLCYGWIDGILKSIDEDSHKQRVTPRRPTSIWSDVNIRNVDRLTKEGRMRPAGLAAFQNRDHTKKYSFENREAAKLDAALEKQFRANREAWAFWAKQPPGYKRLASWFVISAKQDATRQRRLERLVADSAAGRRIGLLEPKKKKENSR